MEQVILFYLWHLNDMDDSMKIFTTYAASLFALVFSISDINSLLQFLVLIATLVYTVINIYKSFKK